MGRTNRAGFAAAVAALAALLPLPAQAGVPADTGPALSVAETDLDQSLVCPHDISSADRNVVILIPGTTLHPDTNFRFSWIREFEALGVPYCYVITPGHSMGDIQVTSEHVVHAIREVHQRSGRTVDVVGYSQGGTNARWALRWWPDLRSMVGDFVGLAPSTHGGDNVNRMCDNGSCQPAIWQQRYESTFIKALNSGRETFPGIDYTVAWTAYDQFLNQPGQPIGGEPTRIDGATNIRLQDICPGNTADHVAIGSYDPVAYAIMIDALTHPDPADPARIDRAVCGKALPPHADPVTFPVNYVRVWAEIFTQLTSSEKVAAEPALKAYAQSH